MARILSAMNNLGKLITHYWSHDQQNPGNADRGKFSSLGVCVTADCVRGKVSSSEVCS